MAETEEKSKVVKKTEKELIDVDELAKELNVTPSIFAGVKMLKGWKKGRQISKEEFIEAVNAFKNTSC
jgi:hypothetical protein